MFQLKAKVIKNIAVRPKYYKISVACAGIAAEALPGQFCEIKVADNDEPLLRRPLSIHGAGTGSLDFLYEVVGPATQILSRKKTGEVLDIIGPLGKGFDCGRRTTDESEAKRSLPEGDGRRILVAGGMGVAPLVFLANKLTDYSPKTTDRRLLVLIGAKTKNQILCEGDFKRLGCDVKVATDNGSKGFRGKVTELLTKILRTALHERRTTIFSCGPRPMLKAIQRLAKGREIPAQISLEAHMACGIGACLGCAVETVDGYKRVCKEGPVFNADEVIF
jgi:dihydroorotate dehydrogenase electron transfer subunit